MKGIDLSDYLEYKGYLGTVEYSAEDNLLCGEVVGIMKGLIMYHGQTLDCLKRDFEDAIDHYISCCEEARRLNAALRRKERDKEQK